MEGLSPTKIINYLHIKGVFLRDSVILWRSWHRMLDLFFFITMQILLWGFITLWIREDVVSPSGGINFVVLLVGALIFWEIFWRSQQSIGIAFLEDVWTRNVLNIFVAPLRVIEFVAGLVSIAVFKVFIGLLFMIVVAWIFYSFNIWDLGFYMVPFVLNLLIFGFSIGIIGVGMIMRFGPSVEVVNWALPFLFQPFSAVFYPVSILPEILQKVAFALPTSHAFEGMRAVLLRGVFPIESVIWSFTLNVLYFVASLAFFYWMLSLSRKRGALGRLVVN